jgi:hypothetical protein
MLYYHAGGGDATPETDPLGTFFKSFGTQQFTDLAKGMGNITKTIQSMDVEMAKVAKTMGLSAAQGLAIKENFSQSYQQIVDLGGKLSDVVGQQEALSNVSGRNLISLQSQSEALFAAVSVTGLKAEELQKSFYDAGMEGAHIAENVAKIVQVSNQLGVNAQAVSSTVTANLDKLNRFGFTNGVEGLAKMAGKAQALRFNMDETLDLADDLMSPEKAIEMASAIQRLGGAATSLTDPLKLMDLAQNDVGGLQDELGKLAKQYTYFDEKTESFQIMPGARRQLKEVADALGIDRKEFEKMALETSKLDDKMSKIKFSGLDISKEDKEQLANLAQLQDSKITGKKEYVVNYKDTEGKMQQAELASLSREQLEAIKKQAAQDSIDAGEDPQKQLVKLAREQLGEFGRLAVAQEKIANTMSVTIGGSKAGQNLLKKGADEYSALANDVTTAFGPNSEFKRKVDVFGEDVGKMGNLLVKLMSGDFTTLATTLGSLTDVLGKGVSDFGLKIYKRYEEALTDQTTAITNLDADVKTASFNFGDLESFKTALEAAKAALGGGDGFKAPRVGGDTLKTPSGDIVLHDKDYFLAATQLPDVLQKSVNKGLMDVLKIERQSMNTAMQTTNTQTQPQTQPQKQEVVHTVNFKVSVDGPKNKLTDMLVEELPKNPTLMQYIVKHFDNTKTSGRMVVKK